MSLTRQEFEDTLTDIFDDLALRGDLIDFKKAVISNDKTLMSNFSTKYLRAQERINFYLTEWDNAIDQAAKDAVVGSVAGDLGNAGVTASSAYIWPPSGHFGNLASPVSPALPLVSQSVIVDGTAIGNTSIFTCPTGKIFIPQIANFTLLNVTGLSIVATCSIGTNSTTFNNILPDGLLTNLNSQYQTSSTSLLSIIPAVVSDEEVFCRVSVASTATTYSLLASICGYFADA